MSNLQPNDYALVIGVNEYPNYRKLDGPVSDAERFAAWLTKPDGGGLDSSNSQLIRNPEFPVGEITVQLSLLINQIDLARKEGRTPRRFYLYFSGHGQSPRIDQINLCLKMWSSTTLSRLALSASDCWAEMVNCAGFAEVAVFLDCCRVWVASAGGMPPGVSCTIPKSSASGTRFFKAYSSEFLQKSFESAEGEVYSGFFTRTLLLGLEGAAASMPGAAITQEALKTYLEAEVPRLSLAEKNVMQQPVVEANLNPGAVFGGANLPDKYRLTVQFKPGRVGPVVLVMPDSSETPCPDPTQEWVLMLRRGVYILIDQGQNPPEEQTIRLREDTNVTF